MNTNLWWTPIVVILMRYVADIFVSLLVGRISPDDAKTLYDTLTGPEFIAGLTTSLIMAGLGIRHWWRLKSQVLTAAAKDSPKAMTQVEVATLAASSAPSIKTPEDVVPKLSKPPQE